MSDHFSEYVMLKAILVAITEGDLSVLDVDTHKIISAMSLQLCSLQEHEFDENQKKSLETLIKICNILYNRTDMTILPVDDAVYDSMMEMYKKFDPNFQVGSYVVDFKPTNLSDVQDEDKIKTPLYFYEKDRIDDVRSYFEKQLLEFNKDRYNSIEAFYKSPLIFDQNDQYITKRTHDTKHNHPSLVGTLDKCKFVLDIDAIEKDVYDKPNTTILERDFFRAHINSGIITEDQEIELVLELKYDGISVEADCNSIVESARTRGDTGIGEAADITPILKGYRFLRNDVLKDRTVGVKFEAIITHDNLQKFNEARGYNYKNCRSAINGLFGASDAHLFRDFITLIPLALDRDDVPEVKNRLEEIELLNSQFKTKGEPLRYQYIKGDYRTCLYLIKKFVDEAKYARNYLNFMFDGVVVSYLDEDIRQKLGRKNSINKYSVAVKFDPLEKLTTFLGYTFEVGQTGTICPMIHYAPVEFFGTIHPKSSGASYKRFLDLSLKPGDIISVSYNNDVMPYVSKHDCEQNRQNQNPLCEFPKVCPVCGTTLEISKTGKTAICPNIDCGGRKVARMVNMLQKMNVKGFAESTILAIGKYTFRELIDVDQDWLSELIGPGNAANFKTAIDNLLSTPTEDYRLVGALGFTNMAARKWKLIFSKWTLREFVEQMIDPKYVYEFIMNIKNLGESAAEIVVNEYPLFKDDIMTLLDRANIIDSKNVVAKKQIRFTGCRNKQLEEQLCKAGYDADGSGSVTKQTDILLIPYEGFSSTKVAKVSEDTIIVPIDEFINNMNLYL